MRLFCVDFACFPCTCLGFLPVLPFTPKAHRCKRDRLICDSKLARSIVNGQSLCAWPATEWSHVHSVHCNSCNVVWIQPKLQGWLKLLHTGSNLLVVLLWRWQLVTCGYFSYVSQRYSMLSLVVTSVTNLKVGKSLALFWLSVLSPSANPQLHLTKSKKIQIIYM